MPEPTLTPAAVEELRRLHEAATPGPWEYDRDGMYVLPAPSELTHPGQADARKGWCLEAAGHNDAELTVALRNAAPALLDEVAALRARVAELEKIGREYVEETDGVIERLRAHVEALEKERDEARAQVDAARKALDDVCGSLGKTYHAMPRGNFRDDVARVLADIRAALARLGKEGA